MRPLRYPAPFATSSHAGERFFFSSSEFPNSTLSHLTRMLLWEIGLWCPLLPALAICSLLTSPRMWGAGVRLGWPKGSERCCHLLGALTTPGVQEGSALILTYNSLTFLCLYQCHSCFPWALAFKNTWHIKYHLSPSVSCDLFSKETISTEHMKLLKHNRK